MYASHKKDINRHKSFHPLTGRNLGKVEQRRQQEEEEKKRAAERGEQLRRDQEQRRYDDLVLAASADGPDGRLAKLRRVENIFAAEETTAVATPPVCKSVGGCTLNFRREETQPGVERGEGAGEGDGRKRGRGDDEQEISKKNNNNNSGGGGVNSQQVKKVVTGFLSSSDAAQLAKELDVLQKERHDPLRRIERFQNRTVAAEAKRRALETKTSSLPTTTMTSPDTEKDVIRSRIQELLQMKKKR